MSKKILIKCDEASTICDKSQYCEASFYDKVRLQIHLFICKKCGLYSKQNKMMTRLFKVQTTHQHEEHLSEADKHDLKEKLKQEAP
jgi:glutamate synthase domain-containing protein 2